MVLFELLQLFGIFSDYPGVEYLWHDPIMPSTKRNGIRSSYPGCGMAQGRWRPKRPGAPVEHPTPNATSYGALGGACGALARRLLDRRQRGRHVLQGLPFGPHPEHQLDDGRQDHQSRADEVPDEQVCGVARADELAEDDGP